MALKTLNYSVDIAGITPATEQFGGTQGDHKVTTIEFILTDELYETVTDESGDVRHMYRFDVYDGEGGIWSSVPEEITENTVSITLEERHTRFGGKITVYLVITALSEDNKTEMELYSFPAVLRFNNKPDGTYQQGENYESISSLAESAKNNALAAETSNRQVEGLAAQVEEKLQNGEFDGVGIESAEIVDDELVITYTDGTVQNLGNVKGEQGPKGEKGDQGETGADGIDAVTDQRYNAESENAQSGKAVAEALQSSVQKVKGVWQCEQLYGVAAIDNEYLDKMLSVEDHAFFEYNNDYGSIPRRQSNGNLMTNTPVKDLDCANKKYVDDLIGDIEALLGGI